MEAELNVLLLTAASLGFVHTALGPDHYLPFIAMARSGKWSYIKTTWITVLCGIGHVASSIIIGSIGLAVGIGVSKIESLETIRGDLAAWLFVLFGALYMGWGLWRALKNKPHKHFHFHANGKKHEHMHDHIQDHDHTHNYEKPLQFTPWVLFLIFVLGPCEPLIFTLMYPASKMDTSGIILIVTIFSVVTIATMLTIVLLLTYGIKKVPSGNWEKYSHAFAGGIILLSGLGILMLGL